MKKSSYPSWRYHKELGGLVVKNEQEEKNLGEGWHHSPAEFGQEEVKAYSVGEGEVSILEKPAKLTKKHEKPEEKPEEIEQISSPEEIKEESESFEEPSFETKNKSKKVSK